MSRSGDNEPLLYATLRLDSVPSGGRAVHVDAEEAQRKAVAERLGILRVDRFTADLMAMRLQGGIHVRGTLRAEVAQSCVVTFEPVPEVIDEPVDRIFLHGREDELPAGSETFIDLEDEDLPDRFEGHEVDLAELLVETLALTLNPYPRLEGAQLTPDLSGDDPDLASPFAGLKSLKSTKD